MPLGVVLNMFEGNIVMFLDLRPPLLPLFPAGRPR